MSVNTSSSSSDSALHQHLHSNSSLRFLMQCFSTGPSSFMFGAYAIVGVSLLLPLCFLVLCHGLQQQRNKGSSSSATTWTHSDCFTFHMAIMELIDVLGSILCLCAISRHHLGLLTAGFFFLSVTWCGQMLLHILTCAERYLAVVHPVTYMSLRNERGTRIRNVSTGCVWLLCFAGAVVMFLTNFANPVLRFIVLVSSLLIISAFSLSVLCVLARPGPGGRAGGGQGGDQSKQRAFCTIVTIVTVLIVKFGWNLIADVLYVSRTDGACLFVMLGFWLHVPSSFVMPLLFLRRAGKCRCCK